MALRSAILYALGGLFWLLVSDRIAEMIAAGNPVLEGRLRLFERWAFIIATATLLFLVLKRRLGRWEEQRVAREAAVEERLLLERRLSKLAEIAPDVMFSFRLHLDGHFSFPFANRRIEDFFASSVEALASDASAAIASIHEEDISTFLAAVESSRDSLSAFRQELRLCHPERGVIWIDVHSMPEQESDGGTLWHGFFRDITDRHEAQAQIREMAGLLHAVVEQTTDAVFVKDHAGRYLLFNEAASGFVGRPVPEVLGRDDREIFDPESAATLIARDRRVMATGVAETEEETITTTAGVERTFLAMKAPFRDSEGEVVGTIGISRDITERNQVAVALRASEERLVFALDATLDGIWDWNVQTGEVYFSPQSARVLGFEQEEVSQRIDFFFKVLHPDDTERVKRAFEDHLEGRTSVKQDEVRLRMKSGEYRWFLDRGKVVSRDDAGNALRMVGTITDITERKQAEVALHASEQLYRSIVTTLSEGLILQEADGRITATNPSAERILGLSADQLAGRTSLDPLWRAVREDGSDFPGEEHPAMVAIRTGQPQMGVPMGLHRADGSLVWVSINAQPVFAGDADAVASVVCSFTDVTARKRAESFTEEHMRVLETIASGAPVETTLDALLRLIEEQCGEMFCAIFLPDADGIHLRTAAGPRIPPAFRKAIDGIEVGPAMGTCGAAIHRHEAVFVEDIATDPLCARFRQSALEHDLHACWSTPIFDRHREVLGCFTVYYQKPTGPDDEHRHWIDLATHTAAVAISRHRGEAALRESERRYRQLIAGLPVALYTTDAEGYITLFNEAAEKLWGRSPQPGVDRWSGAYALYTVDGDPLPHAEHPICTAIHDARPVRGAELTAERPDGTRIHFLAYPNPIYDQNGRITGAMNVMVDITQRKAAEAALQKAYDELRQTQEMVVKQERLRAFGEMASGVAHDINNAIFPLSIYTGVLLDTEPDLSDRARGFVEIIQQVGEGVRATVARLREFYRRQDGPRGLLPVNLAALAGEVVTLTRPRWSDMAQERGAHINVRTELEAAQLQIAGVESEIREALVNLVFNAVDAMPEGGTITIRAGTVRPRRSTRAPGTAPSLFLEVEDTGVGMDEEARRRCLEPFYTTKGEHGTGLGLAIVCGILERHEAKVAIESEPGAGTTIRLIFPLPEALPDSPPEPAEFEALPPLKILVVDDDANILTAMRVALMADGHDVQCVPGGQAGLDAFEAALEAGEPFDAIFTNLGMPDIDGRKVAVAVKAASPTTPVILLTGWGHSMQADGDIPPGVDRIVGKPASPRDLNEALAFCCALRPVAS